MSDICDVEYFRTPLLPGKTLLARTLAEILDVPFSVSDATAFTQVCHHPVIVDCVSDINSGRLYVISLLRLKFSSYIGFRRW